MLSAYPAEAGQARRTGKPGNLNAGAPYLRALGLLLRITKSGESLYIYIDFVAHIFFMLYLNVVCQFISCGFFAFCGKKFAISLDPL